MRRIISSRNEQAILTNFNEDGIHVDRSKRVCHLQKMTGVAGSENFLIELGRGLTEREWEGHFGLIEEASSPADRAAERLADAGWTVKRLPYPSSGLPLLLPELRSWLEEVEPALVHTHLLHADLLGGLASLGLDPPVLTTKHNDDRFKHAPGYGWFARGLNRCFDRGIAISHHLESFYRNELGVTSLPWETIHYGLDPGPFEKTRSKTNPDGPLTFGIVARLTKQKGHTTLLEAFERIVRDGVKAELKIVGDGPLRDSLERRVEELELNERVRFEGYREDVADALAEFDVFVHPSRWEGFGLVFLEAMAAKLPVVATNVSAIPEIVVDGETGLLVEPDRPIQLAEAMEKLAGNGKRRRSFGKAGYRRLLNEFSVPAMIDAHDRLYRGMTEDGQ